MTIKNLLLATCASFLALVSFSQSITGKIVDAQESPLPFVNVILNLNDSTNQLVKASVSDVNGDFSLKNISAGKYKMYISLVGFNPYNQEVEVSSGKLDLGRITLIETSEQIDAATVIGKIPLIEVEPDRTVFNVSQNLSSSGNSALEVLRMAPGVQIDNDNNIIVEGKSGVIVYIDDRQSYLTGEELEAFLLSLQADEIEKIEIITQPSSKYDAAGNAGIINIILKREKGLGTSGYASLTGTYGQYARGNGQIGFTTRTKKFHVTGNYSNFVGETFYFFDFEREQNNKLFDSYTRTVTENLNNNVRFSVDYDINDKHTIGTGFRLNLSDQDGLTTNDTGIGSFGFATPDSTLIATTAEDKNNHNIYSNVFYMYKDTVGNSLTVDFNYGGFGQSRENLLNNQYQLSDGDVIGINSTLQDTPIDIDIYVGQLDYEKKLEKASLSTGFKYSQVITDNTFDIFNVVNAEQIQDTDRSNQFVYDESIYAAYLNYNRPLSKKLKFQGGLRMEHTESTGDLTSLNGQDTTVVRDYTDWFPSGGLTYVPNFSNSWSLVYSRRIQRPGYQSLNPFEFQLNELSFMKGNPFLQPQYTDNIKLSHTYKYTLTSSFSYSHINDFFAQVTQVSEDNDNVSFLQSRNVATQDVYNFSVSYPFTIKKKINVYANVSANYTDYNGTDTTFIDIEQLSYSGFAQASYPITESLNFQLNGWFSGPSVWGGTYQTKSLGSLSMALQKKWDKLTAKVSLNDIFYSQPWRAEVEFPGLRSGGTGGSDSRQVQLYLSWNFGNKTVKSKKERKTGADDLDNRIE